MLKYGHVKRYSDTSVGDFSKTMRLSKGHVSLTLWRITMLLRMPTLVVRFKED